MRNTNNYIALSLGAVLAFASYKIGEDDGDLPIEIKGPEPVVEKATNPVSKPKVKDKISKSIYSLFPEGSEQKLDLGSVFDDANEENRDFYSIYDISIENYMDGDITTKCDNNVSPVMQGFCIQDDSNNQPRANADPNSLNLKIGEKADASYNYDCLIQDNNQNPVGVVDTTKCLGGYDFNTGSKGDIKIKLRGTMTYDPEAELTTEDKFGVCPEGDLSKCAGVEIGVEINY